MGWIEYNPNPEGKRVDDCVVRALCKALNMDWERTFSELTVVAYSMHDMPCANQVWGALLRRKGWKRYSVEDRGVDNYTLEDFCEDFKKGKYIVAVPGHVICVENGNYYDTWDSGHEYPLYYWRA